MEQKLMIVKEYPSIKKDIDIVERILTHLEKWLLITLLKEKSALSTRSLYIKKMIDNFEAYAYPDTSKDDWTKKKVMPNSMGYPLDPKKYGAYQDPRPHEFHKMVEDYEAIKHGSQTEIIDFIKPKMQRKAISYPSYEKIQADLERLEYWNIVMKRKDNDEEGTKYYWVINPLFDIEFRNQYDKILNWKLI